MNSLAQEHYAAALSGAPPGYAGSKEQFSLFDRDTVEGTPSRPGVVLFDEVEKAHQTVLRALLQILDTDACAWHRARQPSTSATPSCFSRRTWDRGRSTTSSAIRCDG